MEIIHTYATFLYLSGRVTAYPDFIRRPVFKARAKVEILHGDQCQVPDYLGGYNDIRTKLTIVVSVHRYKDI